MNVSSSHVDSHVDSHVNSCANSCLNSCVSSHRNSSDDSSGGTHANSSRARPRGEQSTRSRFAPCLTHASILLMTALYYGLLLRLPLWAAFVPGVFLVHRIGVMLHEYFHGIAFDRYRHNHAVVTLWDGIMMTFGVLEVVRGMHLSHHKWLNVPTPDHDLAQVHNEKHSHGVLSFVAAFDAARHLSFFADGLRGKTPYVGSGRIVLGFVLSVIAVATWVVSGHADILWRSFAVVAFTVFVPFSLRGAIEHSSSPGAPGFANEYTTFLPIFNVNRHIHHHEDPTVPWYLLEWRTPKPLPAWNYLTHWFRVHITHELVQMRPMPKRRARPPKERAGTAGLTDR